MLNLGFYNTTAQEMIAFQDVLFSAGFTPADMASVVEEPSLASLMHAAIKPQHFVPEWYISPEQQLERARQLWPDAVLPEPPEGFTPRTRFEVLLLHVPESLDSLWDKVVPPEGYTKEKQEGKWKLRLTLRKREYAEPVWVAFDPERGKGQSADSFLSREDVATTEVISAIIQFPGWPLAWSNGASAPLLTGYQVDYWDWSKVPVLVRSDEENLIRLSRNAYANISSFNFANP